MSPSRDRVPSWAVFVSIVLVGVAGWWLSRAGDGAISVVDLVRLELAFTEGTAASVLSDLGSAGVTDGALRSAVLRDFAFIAAYLVAGQVVFMWLHGAGSLGLRVTGFMLAAVVAAAVFDVIENTALLIWYDDLAAIGVGLWSAAAALKWILAIVVLTAVGYGLVRVARLRLVKRSVG